MLSACAPYDGVMSAETSLSRRSPWLAPVLRAIPALAVGLTITFTADHSVMLGLITLSVFGLSSALVLFVTSVRLAADDTLRGLHRGLTVIAAVVGVLAAVAAAASGAVLPVLLLLVGGYAVLAGALELVWGIRHRDRNPLARDAVIIGIGTLTLAVVLALVADPVSAVGFFGAYAVVLGVFLVIAGFSVRWTPSPKEHTP